MSEAKPLSPVASAAMIAVFAAGMGAVTAFGLSNLGEDNEEIRAEVSELEDSVMINSIYAEHMAGAIETRFLNIEREIALLRGSSEPLEERIDARDLSLSISGLLADVPAYQMYVGTFGEKEPLGGEAQDATRRLDELETDVQRLQGMLIENGIDPETGEPVVR